MDAAVTLDLGRLPRLLDRFEQLLVAAGAPVAHALRPGLSDEEIDAAIAPSGVGLPYEARVLFRWHDGAGAGTGDGGPPLMSIWCFPSLQDHVRWFSGDWHTWKQEIYGSEDKSEEAWGGFFPIFRTADRQTTIAIEYPDREGWIRHVAEWALWDAVPSVMALRHMSLLSLLETWVWWLTSSAMVWDKKTETWQAGPEPLHWSTYRQGLC